MPPSVCLCAKWRLRYDAHSKHTSIRRCYHSNDSHSKRIHLRRVTLNATVAPSNRNQCRITDNRIMKIMANEEEEINIPSIPCNTRSWNSMLSAWVGTVVCVCVYSNNVHIAKIAYKLLVGLRVCVCLRCRTRHHDGVRSFLLPCCVRMWWRALVLYIDNGTFVRNTLKIQIHTHNFYCNLHCKVIMETARGRTVRIDVYLNEWINHTADVLAHIIMNLYVLYSQIENV